jgi:hypothetical protein
VAAFEPTREWERAVLVLTMLQGVRWKNRLFNAGLEGLAEASGEPVAGPASGASCPDSGSGPVFSQENRGKVLCFRPRQGDESV